MLFSQNNRSQNIVRFKQTLAAPTVDEDEEMIPATPPKYKSINSSAFSASLSKLHNSRVPKRQKIKPPPLTQLESPLSQSKDTMICHRSYSNPPFYKESPNKLEDSNLMNFDFDKSSERCNIVSSARGLDERSLTLDHNEQSEILNKSIHHKRLIFEHYPLGGMKINESTIHEIRENSRLVSHFRTRSLTEDHEIRRSDNFQQEYSKENPQIFRLSHKSQEGNSIDKKFYQFKIDMEKVLNSLKEEATKDLKRALNNQLNRQEVAIPHHSPSTLHQQRKFDEKEEVYRKHTFNYTEEDSKENFADYQFQSHNSCGNRASIAMPTLSYDFPRPRTNELLQKTLVTIDETDRSYSLISGEREDIKKRSKRLEIQQLMIQKNSLPSSNSRNSHKKTDETLATELTRVKDVVFIQMDEEEKRRSLALGYGMDSTERFNEPEDSADYISIGHYSEEGKFATARDGCHSAMQNVSIDESPENHDNSTARAHNTPYSADNLKVTPVKDFASIGSSFEKELENLTKKFQYVIKQDQTVCTLPDKVYREMVDSSRSESTSFRNVPVLYSDNYRRNFSKISDDKQGTLDSQVKSSETQQNQSPLLMQDYQLSENEKKQRIYQTNSELSAKSENKNSKIITNYNFKKEVSEQVNSISNSGSSISGSIKKSEYNEKIPLENCVIENQNISHNKSSSSGFLILQPLNEFKKGNKTQAYDFSEMKTMIDRIEKTPLQHSIIHSHLFETSRHEGKQDCHKVNCSIENPFRKRKIQEFPVDQSFGYEKIQDINYRSQFDSDRSQIRENSVNIFKQILIPSTERMNIKSPSNNSQESNTRRTCKSEEPPLTHLQATSRTKKEEKENINKFNPFKSPPKVYSTPYNLYSNGDKEVGSCSSRHRLDTYFENEYIAKGDGEDGVSSSSGFFQTARGPHHNRTTRSNYTQYNSFTDGTPIKSVTSRLGTLEVGMKITNEDEKALENIDMSPKMEAVASSTPEHVYQKSLYIF